MTGDSRPPGRHEGETPHDRRESWLRAFEVAVDVDVDRTAVDDAEMEAGKEAFLARIRASSTPADDRRRRPVWRGVRDLGRTLTGAPLLLLVLMVVLATVLPSGAPLGGVLLGVALFVVAPVALVLKWAVEAYSGGHELARGGELLSENAHEFRILRRRLEALLDDVAGPGGDTPAGAEATERADLRAGIGTVRDLVGAMTDRLRRGSRGARGFASLWRSEPADACERLAPELQYLEPDSVDAELTTLVQRLTGLQANVGALAVVAPAGTFDAAGTSNEIEDVRRLVAHGRESIVRECRHLYWSFDWLHSGAARKVLVRRMPGWVLRTSFVGVVGLIGLVRTNLSTRDPVARTRRRVRYLDLVDDPANRSVGGIRRATGAAVRDEQAAVLVDAGAA